MDKIITMELYGTSVKKIALGILIFLTSFNFQSIRSEQSKEATMMWSSNKFTVLASLNDCLLIEREEINHIFFSDLVKSDSGKSVWGDNSNDLREFLINNRDWYLESIQEDKLIIFYSFGGEVSYYKCFDIMTGKKIWENKNLTLFHRYTRQVYVAEKKVYTTYYDLADSSFVQLLEFDLKTGKVTKNKDIYLYFDLPKTTNARNKYYESPRIFGYTCGKIYIYYSYYLQCYDLNLDRVIWYKKMITGLTIYDNISVSDNKLIYSEEEYGECALINVIVVLDALTGRQLYQTFGSSNWLYKDGHLYYLYLSCEWDEDRSKDKKFYKTDIKTFIDENVIDNFAKGTGSYDYNDFFHSRFGSRYICGKNIQDDKSSKTTLDFYDYNLNPAFSIEKNGKIKNIILKNIDNFFTITYTLMDSNESFTEVYKLPE